MNPLNNQTHTHTTWRTSCHAHTQIRGMRETAAQEGRPPRPLVFVTPEQSLADVVRALHGGRVSMAPILSCDPSGRDGRGGGVPTVLHVATLGGVLACLLRHFRASLASLPLLARPIGGLALGTWSEAAAAAHPRDHLLPAPPLLPPGGGGGGEAGGMSAAAAAASDGGHAAAGHAAANGAPALLAHDGRGGATFAGKDGGALRVRPLAVVTPDTPLTAALGLLLEAGVSALPVVDAAGRLLDVYARADITHLCRGGAYSRLQWEDVTVGQALALSSPAPPQQQQQSYGGAPWGSGGGGGALGGPLLPPPPASSSGGGGGDAALPGGVKPGGRVAVAARDEPLRAAVERLAVPGVRRLVVVDRASGAVEGVVSLSDVAQLLFL